MNIKSAAVVLSATLALAACGGDDGGSDGASPSTPAATSSEGASEGGAGMAPDGEDPRGDVPEVDVAALGQRLGWEGCEDEPVVDMAGYTKVVCIIPDEHAVPGQDGNAVGIVAFDEWAQADEYVNSYGDPEVTVIEDGYIVDGPHAEGVDAAVAALKE